jgi:hypothetical protein
MRRYKWSDGKTYYGQYKKGKRHGFGKQKYNNGNSYEGEWKNDKKDGSGVMTYKTNGQVYRGNWKGNKKEGNGVLLTETGERIQQVMQIPFVDNRSLRCGKMVRSKTTQSQKIDPMNPVCCSSLQC